MYLKKIIAKVFTSKFVGTGPSSYKKRIYRAAVSQRLRNTDLHYEWDIKHLLKIDIFIILGVTSHCDVNIQGC
jgi:hypothetical protein